MSDAENPSPLSRRRFLLAGLSFGAGGLALAAGAADAFFGRARPEPPGPAPLLPLAEVGRGDLAPLAEAGRPVAIRVTLARRDRWRAETIEREVFVRRTGFGRPEECFEALSPICPHAGCLVRLENDGAGFLCPCHRAVFDSAGRLVDGPSPRALDVLPVSVGSYEGEPWLFVQWQGFASGGEQGAARG